MITFKRIRDGLTISVPEGNPRANLMAASDAFELIEGEVPELEEATVDGRELENKVEPAEKPAGAKKAPAKKKSGAEYRKERAAKAAAAEAEALAEAEAEAPADGAEPEADADEGQGE